jgi:hypothetical protein
MDLVDCRIELASDLWPIRDGERRKRVYAAIREACLDEGHIMFVLLTPELATDMWVNDYGSEGTLQGKLLVNEDEYVENMIKV